MSLSDCPKCWDTPCSCGYEYKDMSTESKHRLAAVVLGMSVAELDDKLSCKGKHVSDEASQRDDVKHTGDLK